MPVVIKPMIKSAAIQALTPTASWIYQGVEVSSAARTLATSTGASAPKYPSATKVSTTVFMLAIRHLPGTGNFLQPVDGQSRLKNNDDPDEKETQGIKISFSHFLTNDESNDNNQTKGSQGQHKEVVNGMGI